jgi:phenylacetic acid degradation operon negative regulatory protein
LSVDAIVSSPYDTVVVDTTVSIPTRILVLGMAHEDGTILAAEVYPVAAACGQTGDQVRSCLRRLVREGLFVQTGIGRDASYRATEAGMSALGADVERTRLAYGQDAAGRGWDRHWYLVAFAVPEQRRAARDAFRDRLLALGGASIQGGLYVSPHQWHKDVKAAAERLGIAELSLAASDDLEVAGDRDPRDIAKRLWPVDDMARRYREFVDVYAGVPDALTEMRGRREKLSDATFLPGALHMAVAFMDVFTGDPLLPPELLPRPWPGRAARDLLVRSRRMALSLRHGPRPALFHSYDEAIEALP